MVVMDQFTRRIIGFGVHVEALHVPAVCYIFNEVIAGSWTKRLLNDNDFY